MILKHLKMQQKFVMEIFASRIFLFVVVVEKIE